MKILRFSLIFSQLTSIAVIIVIYLFAVPVFQPVKVYPNHIQKTLFLDRYLRADEVDFITKSALEWSEATNHVVDFNVVTLPHENITITDNDIIVMSISPDHPDIIALDVENNFITLGYYNPNTPIPSIYLVSDRISDEDYIAVVLHELGHSLDLEHNEGLDGIGTLMFPDISFAANHITVDDLRHFCKLYHCEVKESQN